MPKNAKRDKGSDKGKGDMTVSEAGRLGGHKGGETVKEKYGPEFFSEIGSQSHKNDPGREADRDCDKR